MKSRRPSGPPDIGWTYVPKLKPGNYRALSRGANVYLDRQFKRWVCAVQFDILNDSLIEVVARCTWYLNLGSKEKPWASRRSLYWSAWVTANGGLPSRRDRISERVFVNRYATVEVANTSQNFKSAKVEETEAYSVVKRVVEWETASTNQLNHTSSRAPKQHSRQKTYRKRLSGDGLRSSGPALGQG